jgi:hypothetical protein
LRREQQKDRWAGVRRDVVVQTNETSITTNRVIGLRAYRWTARTSVANAEFAAALDMMTINAFSFLLKGPWYS